MQNSDLYPARWWQPEADGRLLCTLCPRFCRLAEGQAGFCYVRQNQAGQLVTSAYNRSTGFAIDPIEKKPLNHFLPGTSILSFGTAGCNLGCRFCQNWHISKAKLVEAGSQVVRAEQVVDLAQQHACPSIAMTYNDPTIFAEYAMDVARCARERGIHPVLVTAGYITPDARRELYRDISAANVDLKAFSETFYQKLTFSHLEPVLETLRWLKHETDIWFELTNLMIPAENDAWDETKRMCDWILQELGPGIPLHFTAFHPDFKLLERPRTPIETLQRARRIALSMGLQHVYVGNVHDPEGQTTYCSHCQLPLIERDWHQIKQLRVQSGKCPDCQTLLAGRFDVFDSGFLASVSENS